MDCSEPGLIREEEWLAYLAGDKVQPAVELHLMRCSRCSAQLADYRRLELSLASKLYRWDCPSGQMLGEYQLGLLNAEEALAVKTHIRACKICAADLATLEVFLGVDPLAIAQTSPARAVDQRSVHNHHQRSNSVLGLDALLDSASTQTRRIIASLVPMQPRLAYQRHSAASTDWPRRYVSGDFSISLQIGHAIGRDDSLQLLGLVTCKDAPLEMLEGLAVQLSSHSSIPAVYTQKLDELGNFLFSSLESALYTLELQAPEGMIVIEQIPVGIQS